MSARATFLALANRCEQEQPSADLDRDIDVVVTGQRREGNFEEYVAPSYTSSIDAAASLEPKNAQEICVRKYPAGMYVRITLASGKAVYSEALESNLREPAARAAAALRALSTTVRG